MERAVLLERGARGRQPDGVGEIGVGRGPGHDRDAICQARVLSGKERERCPDRNADQADAPAACVGPGGGGPHDAGRRRHLLDDYLPAGEAGRVGHENEEARAGEAAREPLYVGMPAAAGGHAVEEGEHGPRLPPPGRTTGVGTPPMTLSSACGVSVATRVTHPSTGTFTVIESTSAVRTCDPPRIGRRWLRSGHGGAERARSATTCRGHDSSQLTSRSDARFGPFSAASCRDGVHPILHTTFADGP